MNKEGSKPRSTEYKPSVPPISATSATSATSAASSASTTPTIVKPLQSPSSASKLPTVEKSTVYNSSSSSKSTTPLRYSASATATVAKPTQRATVWKAPASTWPPRFSTSATSATSATSGRPPRYAASAASATSNPLGFNKIYNCQTNRLNRDLLNEDVYNNLYYKYNDDLIEDKTLESLNSNEFIKKNILDLGHYMLTISDISAHPTVYKTYISDLISKELNYYNIIYLSSIFDSFLQTFTYESDVFNIDRLDLTEEDSIKLNGLKDLFGKSNIYHSYLSCSTVASLIDIEGFTEMLLLNFFYYYITCKYYNEKYFNIDKQLFIQIILFKLITCIVQRCISSFGKHFNKININRSESRSRLNPADASASASTFDSERETSKHRSIIKGLFYILYLILYEFYNYSYAITSIFAVVENIKFILSSQEGIDIAELNIFFSEVNEHRLHDFICKYNFNLNRIIERITRLDDDNTETFKSEYKIRIISLLNEIKLLLVNDIFFQNMCKFFDMIFIPNTNILNNKSIIITNNTQKKRKGDFIYINNILQYLYIVNEIMEELCDERIEERDREEEEEQKRIKLEKEKEERKETEQAGFTFVKPKNPNPKPTSRGNQQTTIWSKSKSNPKSKPNSKF